MENWFLKQMSMKTEINPKRVKLVVLTIISIFANHEEKEI